MQHCPAARFDEQEPMGDQLPLRQEHTAILHTLDTYAATPSEECERALKRADSLLSTTRPRKSFHAASREIAASAAIGRCVRPPAASASTSSCSPSSSKSA